jgi:hypothetical protein
MNLTTFSNVNKKVVISAALSLVTTPLFAQSPTARADTTQIRETAIAFSRPETVVVSGRLRIIADTAWAFVHNPDSVMHLHGPATMGTAVRLRAVRVQRRAGTWVAVQLAPKALP